jgi:hypothetical protein
MAPLQQVKEKYGFTSLRMDLGPIRCDCCSKTYDGNDHTVLCGPGAFICQECVEVCHEIIADDIKFHAMRPDYKSPVVRREPVLGYRYLVTMGPVGAVRLRLIQAFAMALGTRWPSVQQLYE